MLKKNNVSNNQVIDYACWTNGDGAILSFYCIKGSFVDDIYDCISEFDLPICRSFFDGRFIFVPNDIHEMLQTRRTPLTTKPIDDSNMAIGADNLSYMLEHADKYRSRGFEINLPKTICVKQTISCFGIWSCITDDVIKKLYSVSKKELDRYTNVEKKIMDLLSCGKDTREILMCELYLRIKLIKK